MEPRARAWSIVGMSVLCGVLVYVLLRSPPHVRQHGPETPTPEEVSTQGNPYRGWPLFQGWPLPQPPDAKPTKPTKPVEPTPER